MPRPKGYVAALRSETDPFSKLQFARYGDLWPKAKGLLGPMHVLAQSGREFESPGRVFVEHSPDSGIPNTYVQCVKTILQTLFECIEKKNGDALRTAARIVEEVDLLEDGDGWWDFPGKDPVRTLLIRFFTPLSKPPVRPERRFDRSKKVPFRKGQGFWKRIDAAIQAGRPVTRADLKGAPVSVLISEGFPILEPMTTKELRVFVRKHTGIDRPDSVLRELCKGLGIPIKRGLLGRKPKRAHLSK